MPTFSQLREGDDKVWESFYKSVRPRLLTRAARAVGSNNAEDLVESTFVSVYARLTDKQKPPLKESQGGPVAYIERSFTYTLYDSSRKEKRNKTSVLLPDSPDKGAEGAAQNFFESVEDKSANVEVVLEKSSSANEEVSKLEKALSKNANWTKMLVLAAEGYSMQEIADTLHVPVGTVLSGMHRAREKAKQSATEIFGREVVEYHVNHLRNPSKYS